MMLRGLESTCVEVRIELGYVVLLVVVLMSCCWGRVDEMFLRCGCRNFQFQIDLFGDNKNEIPK
jgi:hypothetical protein